MSANRKDQCTKHNQMIFEYNGNAAVPINRSITPCRWHLILIFLFFSYLEKKKPKFYCVFGCGHVKVGIRKRIFSFLNWPNWPMSSFWNISLLCIYPDFYRLIACANMQIIHCRASTSHSHRFCCCLSNIFLILNFVFFFFFFTHLVSAGIFFLLASGTLSAGLSRFFFRAKFHHA